MTSHPFHYDRLVAERHAQIQRDMQLSRAQARIEQQPTSWLPGVTRLDTRQHKSDTTERQSLLRAS